MADRKLLNQSLDEPHNGTPTVLFKSQIVQQIQRSAVFGSKVLCCQKDLGYIRCAQIGWRRGRLPITKMRRQTSIEKGCPRFDMGFWALDPVENGIFAMRSCFLSSRRRLGEGGGKALAQQVLERRGAFKACSRSSPSKSAQSREDPSSHGRRKM